jgi:hypothetical protein
MSIQQGLCGFNSLLYAVWKGVIGDEGLWFSSFGANWSAQQQIPGVASSIGPSLAEFGGKLYAAWKGAANDQGLWYASFDGANWSAQQQIPGAASSIGPSLAEFGGKLYAAWKGWWDDQTLWYASFDGTNWSPQQQIPAVWSSIGPSLAEFGGKLYAAWKGMGDDQRLWYASFDGAKWSGQQQIPGVSSSIGPSLAVLGGKLYAAWKGMHDDQRLWYASFDGTNWSAQKNIPGFTEQDVVPAPPSGLHSHTNYYLYSYCKPLMNLSVDIYVFQDIVWQSSINGSTTGFGFQLNADSPQNQKCAWQQYCINLVDNKILGGICNWQLVAATGNLDLIFPVQWFDLAQVPTPSTLPAGYHLKISLQNDAQGNVSGATYAVTDNNGKTLANITKTLLSVPGVTSADIAPITDFELNLVGPWNGQASILSSGAGRFVYTAQNVLVVLNQEPWCVDSWGIFTLENANSIYGDLLDIPAYSFWQSFNVHDTAMPMLPRPGKPRHPGLPPPGSKTRTKS